MSTRVKNTLHVVGPAAEVERFILLAASTPDAYVPLSFAPVVSEWTRQGSSLDGETQALCEELGERDPRAAAANAELVSEKPTHAHYRFDSEHNPPHAHVRAASELFPTLYFLLEYEHEGHGLGGRVVVHRGDTIDRVRRDDEPRPDAGPERDIFAPYLSAALVTVTVGAASRTVALTPAELADIATSAQEEPTDYLIVRWCRDAVLYYLDWEEELEGEASAPGADAVIAVGRLTRTVELTPAQVSGVAKGLRLEAGDETTALWFAKQIEYGVRVAADSFDEDLPPYQVGSRSRFTVEYRGVCHEVVKSEDDRGTALVLNPLSGRPPDRAIAHCADCGPGGAVRVTVSAEGVTLAAGEVLVREDHEHADLAAALLEAGILATRACAAEATAAPAPTPYRHAGLAGRSARVYRLLV